MFIVRIVFLYERSLQRKILDVIDLCIPNDATLAGNGNRCGREIAEINFELKTVAHTQ